MSVRNYEVYEMEEDHTKDCISDLVNALGDRHSDLSISAEAKRLIALGQHAESILLQNIRVSSYVPYILGSIGSEAAISPLCALLNESGGFERDATYHGEGHRARCAAEALGCIGSNTCIPSLELLLSQTQIGEVANAARAALGNIRHLGVYGKTSDALSALTLSQQESLAKDTATDPEILAQIATSNEIAVVMAVAENPSTPHSVLRTLNKQYPPEVGSLYWQLVNNPNCPRDILEIIARCGNDLTESKAREHPNYNMIDELSLGDSSDIDAVLSNGRTPLTAAAAAGQYDFAKSFVSRGAKRDLPDKHGDTPLILAARAGHYDIVTLLLEHGADPNKSIEHGLTPLIEAVRSGNAKIASALLDAGANIDATNSRGDTALVNASNAASAAILLEHGAQINYDSTFFTGPLHQAVFHDDPEMARLFIRAGARVDSSALDYAKEQHGNEHSAQLISIISSALHRMERDRQIEVERAARDAELKRKEIEEKRKALRQCILCGRPLNWIARGLASDKCYGCYLREQQGGE